VRSRSSSELLEYGEVETGELLIDSDSIASARTESSSDSFLFVGLGLSNEVARFLSLLNVTGAGIAGVFVAS